MPNQLIPHLFRTEYSKIVAVLCKTYGFSQIELAEDFVSDSFLKASETWKVKGFPEHPKAWLYAVAKNKVKDHFQRNATFQTKIEKELRVREECTTELSLDLSEDNIKDSQLRMLFTICHPINPKEAQIALALRVLCGFGVEEIANALLSNKSNINKKLFRAKEKLRESGKELLFPEETEWESRVDNVLSVIYLLFNEGYYATNKEVKIQKELCLEAMRLLYLLLENPKTKLSRANALMALFCFHSSRFEARIDETGNQVLFYDQQREKWNQELIEKGEGFLRKSSAGEEGKYHLEALIAFTHVRMIDEEEKKWNAILQFYNRLLQLEYSPIVALNRTFALSKVYDNELAIKEAVKIGLEGNRQYHALLGELYITVDKEKAKLQWKKALELSSSKSEQQFFGEKLKALEC